MRLNPTMVLPCWRVLDQNDGGYSAVSATVRLVCRFGVLAVAALMANEGCKPAQIRLDCGGALSRLSNPIEWSEKEQVFIELASPPRRKEKLSWVMENWGRVNEHYDIAVMNLIGISLRPAVYQLDEDFAAPLLARIAQDHGLLRQLFWYDRWQDGELWRQYRAGVFSPEYTGPYFVAYQNDVFSREVYGWEKLYWLLKLASMLDRPDFLSGINAETLPQRWETVKAELQRDAAYYRFDAQTGVFALDTRAKQQQRPVSAAAQAWLPPPCPLPDRVYSREGNGGEGLCP